MLGHELRNPLGAILPAAEMLGRGDLASQREVIRRQGEHVVRLVDDLLDVARVTSGKVVLQRQSVELNESLERVIASLRSALDAQRRGMEFRGAGREFELSIGRSHGTLPGRY